MASSGKTKRTTAVQSDTVSNDKNLKHGRGVFQVHNRLVRFFIICIVISLLFCGLIFGVSAMERFLFSHNEFFLLRKIEIEDPSMSWWYNKEDNLAEILELKVGEDNIFSVDLAKLRGFFADQIHEIESVEISRKLPDTLHFKLLGRQPEAYVNSSNSLWVVDGKGVTIPSSHCLNLGELALPFIYSEGVDVNKLGNGNILTDFQPALDFLKIVKIEYPGMSIKSIVVDNFNEVMDVYMLFEHHPGIYNVRMPIKDLRFYIQKLNDALAQSGGNLGRMVLCEFKGQIIIK